jgi:predicted transcriptional regulator
MEIADVLHAISDIKSLDMFCFIAKESVDVEVLKHKKGLSKKQFYSRASQLLKVGLIKRKKGPFLTYSVWCSCVSCSTHY